MKQPRPISTLAEAAKWMTGSTNVEWTSESLLDFIYRKMEEALDEECEKIDEGIGIEGLDEACTKAEMRARVHDAYCLDISLPPATRIVDRYWRTDTETVEIVEFGRGLTPLLPLIDSRHVRTLLEHRAIELPYPLTSEPWNGDVGYCIDADTAPIITPESLRISAYRLYILADIFNEQNKQEAPPTSVDELDLTIRSKNCLRNENINSIEELIMFSNNELIKVPNLGARSIIEIREKLALRGLKLRDEWQ